MKITRNGIRLVITGLIAISIAVFFILILVGCSSTSPGIPGLYLVKIANNRTKAEVQVGLFSLCAGVGGNLTCAGTLGAAANQSAAAHYLLPGTTTAAPAALQPLLALAAGIQSRTSTGPGGVLAIVYVPLLLGALCFAAAVSSRLACYVFARKSAAADAKGGEDYSSSQGSSRAVVHERNAWRAAVLLTTGAVMAALAAAIATTVAVRALLFAGTSLPGASTSAAAAAAASKSTTALEVTGGTSIQVLEWLLVGLTLLWHPVVEPAWRKVF